MDNDFPALDKENYKTLPAFLMVRECKIRIDKPGLRIKNLVVVKEEKDWRIKEEEWQPMQED